MKNILTAILALVFGGVLAGCGVFRGAEVDETRGWSAQKLYAEARTELAARNWENAIKHYERIEARYPFGRFAQQAMIESAYAQWKNEDPASALATIDRFIKLHPSSPAMDYALYLRGLIHFNDSLGLLGTLTRQRLSERDQQASKDAYQAFAQVQDQFPQSRYAADAQLRMGYIVNSLAESEVHVARYYLRRGAYLAAANRAKQAIIDYERAPAIEEALAIMVESYDRLGLGDLRDDARRVLLRSFPNSRFLAAAGGGGEQGRAWWRPW